MMTARMMILNWVQETSVSAAVVLSAGPLRLVSRAWVVAAVLGGAGGELAVVLEEGAARSRGAEDRR